MREHALGLAVSALLHGGVLWALFAVMQSAPPLENAASQMVPLSLDMFAPQQTAPTVAPAKPAEPTPAEPPPPVATKPVVEKPKPKPVEKPKPKPTPKPVEKPKPQPKPVEASPERSMPATPAMPQVSVASPAPVVAAKPNLPAPSAPAASNLGQLENDYKRSLRNAIEAEKQYPLRARRMRQQGTVVLEIELNRSGRLVKLSVRQSSGSDLLDQAALDSVRAIDGRFAFPAGITREQWSFTLPVNFSLR